jgi:hypothetical protein
MEPISFHSELTTLLYRLALDDAFLAPRRHLSVCVSQWLVGTPYLHHQYPPSTPISILVHACVSLIEIVIHRAAMVCQYLLLLCLDEGEMHHYD